MMSEYSIHNCNRNLIKLDSQNQVLYIDVTDIVYLRFLPFSDELEIAFSGGANVKVQNGRRLLSEIESYIIVKNIEVTSNDS